MSEVDYKHLTCLSRVVLAFSILCKAERSEERSLFNVSFCAWNVKISKFSKNDIIFQKQRLIFTVTFFVVFVKRKIKSSLHSQNYEEACNERRGPSARLSAWVTQLRRNAATEATLGLIGPVRESNSRPPAPIACA